MLRLRIDFFNKSDNMEAKKLCFEVVNRLWNFNNVPVELQKIVEPDPIEYMLKIIEVHMKGEVDIEKVTKTEKMKESKLEVIDLPKGYEHVAKVLEQLNLLYKNTDKKIVDGIIKQLFTPPILIGCDMGEAGGDVSNKSITSQSHCQGCSSLSTISPESYTCDEFGGVLSMDINSPLRSARCKAEYKVSP